MGHRRGKSFAGVASSRSGCTRVCHPSFAEQVEGKTGNLGDKARGGSRPLPGSDFRWMKEYLKL